jgi:hypothetical protein
MAGATVAAATGVTASDATLITVNLSNNYISARDGNHLNADLTGDGHPDLAIANAYFGVLCRQQGLPRFRWLFCEGQPQRYPAAQRHNQGDPFAGSERLGSPVTGFYRTGSHFVGTDELTGSIPLFFKDLRINADTPTEGLLNVTVSTKDYDNAEIQLDSFTYTSNTLDSGLSHTVPDEESSLALLAMGAGGIFALRRWSNGKNTLSVETE